MRKRRKLVLLGVCAAIALIAILTHKTEPEPSYGGHPLSSWVEILSRSHTEEIEAATNAINHIGVAALPFLTKWVQYEPPDWRIKLAKLVEGLPHEKALGLSTRIIEPRAEQLASGTFGAFYVLGTRAAPALNDLCRLINDTNAATSAARAIDNLACLGTNALPALVAVIQNPRHPYRERAVYAVSIMSFFVEPSQLPIPAIINCLGDTNDPAIPQAAFSTLDDLKQAPELCIPAFVSCLQATNSEIRMWAARGLITFARRATNAIPALTNPLADPNAQVRASAVEALHAIAPATYTNTFRQIDFDHPSTLVP